MNPGIVPMDYVHEDGLSLEDLRGCCEVIEKHEFMGIEIAEFQNAWEPGGDPVSPGPLREALSPLLAVDVPTANGGQSLEAAFGKFLG